MIYLIVNVLYNILESNPRIVIFKEVYENPDKESEYCSEYGNKTVSSCGEMFYLALRDTAKDFVRNDKLRKIEWGMLHRATYNYGPFSKNVMLQNLGFAPR